MKLDFQTYKDKVSGCWAGKNIGGVLGAPFEGKRQFNDIDFYTQDLSEGPPPNDDLDLQIVWLEAVGRYGRHVNASLLAEYWLSFVTPNWVEYGTGKANLAAGFAPPLSGHLGNPYRDSCGCFIRSELWACLAPGHPEIAARYAYEDGIVDHSGEGVYGEIFCAAVESAAFVQSDPMTLIRIGLSYIPEDCAVARCVKTAKSCFEQNVDFQEARIRIHNEAPGTFGAQWRRTADVPTEGGKMAFGAPGFDCPENVGFLIAGWLYGRGDFGKSLTLAVACGEDTDCTAATLGAILGIVGGAARLPKKWTNPLNDKITTMCINLTSGGVWVPRTVTELTERVLRLTPSFLGMEDCDILSEGGYAIRCLEGAELFCPEDDYMPRLSTGYWPRGLSVRELTNLPAYVVRHAFPTHMVLIDYGGEPYFAPDAPRKLKISVINNDTMRQQMWCRLRMYAPEGIRLLSGAEYLLQLNTLYGDRGEAEFVIDASEFTGGRLELLIDVSFEGRHTNTPVKAMLVRGQK